MAVEFKVEHKRKTVYQIDPANITVRAALNGRTDLPDISWLIESMVALGQIEPVLVRAEEGKPILVAGFSRWRAAVEINKRKLVEGRLLLDCVYERCNEQEGFLRNIHENLVRNPPTPIDDANNIRRLEKWGRSIDEIAAIYHQPPRWVRGRLALVSLGEEARQAVKAGKLKVTAARAIAKLGEEQQREAIAAGGKPPAAAAAEPSALRRPSATEKVMHLRLVLAGIVESREMPGWLDLTGMSAPDAVVAVGSKLLEMLT